MSVIYILKDDVTIIVLFFFLCVIGVAKNKDEKCF